MRKMISLMLALLMICGMCSAFAEPTRIEVGGGTFTLPDGLNVGLEPLELGAFTLFKAESSDYYVWMVEMYYPELLDDGEFKDINELAEADSRTREQENQVICKVGFETAVGDYFGLYPTAEMITYGASGSGMVIHGSYSVAESYYLNEAGTRGWGVMAISEDGKVEAKKLQAICTNILLSIEENTEMVVITADTASVRKEASLSGAMIRKAVKGESFEYLGEEGNFYILMIDGQQGYVAKGVAEIQ